MIDAARLALGTLTVLPVRPPTRVDRQVSGLAMALAPAVAGVLGSVCLLAVVVLSKVFDPVLVAALVIGLLGVLTRLMHWDGLADTADGLGGAGSSTAALAVMRRGDIGPFGVFAIVLVVLVQVFALAELVAADEAVAVVVAVTLARWPLALACRSGVPAARPTGLGATVAGTVRAPQLVLAAASSAVVVAGAGGWGGLGWWSLAAAGLLTTLWALVGTTYLRRRLGGITGDGLGALVETSTALSLVVLAAAA